MAGSSKQITETGEVIPDRETCPRGNIPLPHTYPFLPPLSMETILGASVYGRTHRERCGRPASWWSFPRPSFPVLKGCQDQVWKGFCQQQCWGIQSFTSLLHWHSSPPVIQMSVERSTGEAIPDTDFTDNKNVQPEPSLDAYSFSKYTAGHSSLLGF